MVSHKPNLIILGDFNARVGKAQPGEESLCQCLGPYNSDGNVTDAGIDLRNFCGDHALRLESTFFPPGCSGLGTWHTGVDACLREQAACVAEVARKVFRNNIDHVLTRWPSAVFEVKSCGVLFPTEPQQSDHRVVVLDVVVSMAPIAQRVRGQRAEKRVAEPEYAALKDPAKAMCVKEEVAAELQRLRDQCVLETNPVQSKTDAVGMLNKVIHQVCGRVLPMRDPSHQSPEWFQRHAKELRVLADAKREAWERVLKLKKPWRKSPVGATTAWVSEVVAWRMCNLAVTSACRKYKSEFWSDLSKIE